MKKLLALMLALVMVLSFAACSDSEAEVEIDSDQKATSAGENTEPNAEVEETGRTVEEALGVWEDIWNGDMSRYEEMAPQDLWKQYKDIYEDGYESWIATSQEGLKSSAEESLALNGGISFQIKTREELPEEDVAMIADAVTSMYELKGENVKAACKIMVEASYEKSEPESGEMFAMQYGDDWYLIMYTVYDKGECSVNFFI